jgi:hypothetical protein
MSHTLFLYVAAKLAFHWHLQQNTPNFHTQTKDFREQLTHNETCCNESEISFKQKSSGFLSCWIFFLPRIILEQLLD